MLVYFWAAIFLQLDCKNADSRSEQSVFSCLQKHMRWSLLIWFNWQQVLNPIHPGTAPNGEPGCTLGAKKQEWSNAENLKSESKKPIFQNSACSFHWLSSSIFTYCSSFGCPASVTPLLISTIWCFGPYKPYIFCEDMILATCQCHSLLSWAQFTVV